VNANF